MTRFVFAGVLVIALLSGCASRPRSALIPTTGLSVVTDTSLPAPVREDLRAPDRPSLIGPFDTLAIDVFGIEDLGREVQVDASGRIALPLVGTVIASGLTSGELAERIQAGLRRNFVRDPRVTVNLKGSVSQVVAIDGEVREPGLYPVTNQLTLMRAIASARGLSEFAKQDDVVILRTVGNQRMAGLYNLGAIRRGAYEDPVIYANDVVVVGDSPSRRLFQQLVGISPLLTAPIIAILNRI